MPSRDHYRAMLTALPTAEWAAYLGEHSGLPGPRGNLELLGAVGDLADATSLRTWAGSDDEYLACCGTAGLGRLVSDPGDADAVGLRHLAEDPRWRVREGVAMALQRVGDRDPGLLRAILRAWRDGGALVQRAAAAGVCEPRLLRDAVTRASAFDVLDAATSVLAATPAHARTDPATRTLRQGLGYCWSVAVAADPATGFPRFERWAGSSDRDVRWLVAENLKKSRLTKADPQGAARIGARLRTP
jgi:hypothetical protein